MIGTWVGKYKIIAEIGDGGHAFVFKGETREGEVAAIKMLKPSVANEDNLEKRFKIEVEALKKLQHPNIVSFKDYIFQSGYHYLVLELMDQGSVENLIEKGPISYRHAIPLFYKVLDAIRFSHDHKYIHRDIKPNNVLINSQGEAKLTDFGVARVVGGGQNLTKKGYVLGTTLYMAPEFISQGVVSVQTDIYALGVTFYEMLTTRKPFEFQTEDEPLVSFARRVCKGAPTPISTYRPIPAELERIVMKTIAQNPKDRHKTAKEVTRDLAKAFPELVEKNIRIPSGRCETVHLSIEELFDFTNVKSNKGRFGTPARVGIAVGACAVLAGLGFGLPAMGVVAESAATLSQFGGLGLGVVVGLLLFFLLGRGKAAAKPEAAASVPAAGPAPGRVAPAKPVAPDRVLPDSTDDFSEDSSADAPFGGTEFEDTIPFHGGVMSKKPFQMTEKSELNAFLVVLAGPDKGRRFGLRPVSRLGRDLRVDIRPHDPEISRYHAAITFDGRGFTLEDLGSTNGTFVNEERVRGKRHLLPGDVVRTGSTSMRFDSSQDPATVR